MCYWNVWHEPRSCLELAFLNDKKWKLTRKTSRTNWITWSDENAAKERTDELRSPLKCSLDRSYIYLTKSTVHSIVARIFKRRSALFIGINFYKIQHCMYLELVICYCGLIEEVLITSTWLYETTRLSVRWYLLFLVVLFSDVYC